MTLSDGGVLGLLIVTALVLFFVVTRLLRQTAQVKEAVQEELRKGREESTRSASELKNDLVTNLKNTTDTISQSTRLVTEMQKNQLESINSRLKELTEATREETSGLRKSVESQLGKLQESNEKKLDQMRQTVDERLHKTLEQRLGESFKIVGDRLEAVQKGLGEMKSLAAGVGDLKRVLTNVRARGTWGEVQLQAILEQILTADQYETNVQVTPGSGERVEFAVKLPGKGMDGSASVWLPIDSKFPQEDYLRLVDLSESGEAEEVKRAADALERTVRVAAKDISPKYIAPPATTDFAIMFLATEGLYAEILRRPGLVESLQANDRIIVTGPTTLSAILNSLRLGFRTLAIEQRASEVWQVLGAVKTEFGKFGGALDKVNGYLVRASKSIEKTHVRTRAMERKLRQVEQLPTDQSAEIFQLDPAQSTSSGDGDDGDLAHE